MPRIPDIPGLKDWKRAFPGRIWHSKRYRDRRSLQDHNVLLIGAGVSSWDISKESAGFANHIYQSSRGGLYDLPISFLPQGATRVGGVKGFEMDTNTKLSDSGAIPGKVLLEDGGELTDIHSVILCTGYVTSYPFLPQLHRDDVNVEGADDHTLVTNEGNMVHNLHKDIFYIEDPSLVFIGVPYHIATFSLFEFQGQAVARVLSGKAELPSKVEMRRQYNERVKAKGLGREFHSLKAPGAEEAYVADLVNWVNEDAERLGIEDRMEGHTPEWHKAKKGREAQIKLMRQAKAEEKQAELKEKPLAREKMSAKDMGTTRQSPKEVVRS